MEDQTTESITQVSSRDGDDLTNGSYRVQAPVAVAGHMDSGSVHSSASQGGSGKKAGRGNLASQSQETAAQKKVRKDIEDLRKRAQTNLELIKSEVAQMLLTFGRQKNVNINIKNGLPKVKALIDQMEHDQETERAKHEEYVWGFEAGPTSVARRRIPVVALTPVSVTREAKGTPDSATTRKAKKRKLEEVGDGVPTPQKRTTTANGEGDDGFVPYSRKKKKKGERSDQARQRDAELLSRKKTVRPARSRRRMATVETVVIRPSEGKTYAQILKELKQKVKPEEADANIRNVRKTASGNVLVAFKAGENGGRVFTTAVQQAVGEQATVTLRTPKTTLEVRDIDATTDKSEVETALRAEVGETCGLDVSLMSPNSYGQIMALVNADLATAAKLVEKGRVKIGWVNCRIRERVVVKRCFKCLGYGHLKAKCTGPDRSGSCWKCGEGEHKARDCPKPRCFLCTEGNPGAHAPGSLKCKSFQKALTAARKDQR